MNDAIGFLASDSRLEGVLREVLGQLPAGLRRRFVLQRSRGPVRSRRELSRLLVVSRIEDLPANGTPPRVQDVPRRWEGHLVFVGHDTPVEALSSVTRLRVRDPARLQLVTADDLDQARSLLRAFVQRLIHAEDSEGILHAWWSRDSLEILTTAFRRIRVPRSSLPALKGAPSERCRDLEVGYDGSYVAWPALDVHLGFEQIEELTSPERALRRRQESDDFNERYGAAIRSVRRAHGLKQSDVPGLSARHVGRIERGEARATSKALRSLARAHDLTETEYLEQVAAALGSG